MSKRLTRDIVTAAVGWHVWLFVNMMVAAPAFASSFVIVELPDERIEVGTAVRQIATAFGAEVVDVDHVSAETDISGIVINGASLGVDKQSQILDYAINLALEKKVPILVVGAVPASVRVPSAAASLVADFDILHIDSDRLSASQYRVAKDASITFELTGLIVPLATAQRLPHQYIQSTVAPYRAIVSLAEPANLPIFVNFRSSGLNVFMLAPPLIDNASPLGIEAAMNGEFGLYGPLAMFIRFALGDYAWHTDSHLANFTVDDPWLREPYGSLSFDGLAQLSRQEPFHLTVAFIPWNYDRSEAQVVALFREHPELFSVSLHGNNHDHEEFRAQRPLTKHETNIRQGLARMERFKELTGLDYDKVMVFPHQIAPNSVVELLRQYGFLCTANLQNSRDATTLLGPQPTLWSALLEPKHGVPSLKRELPWITTPELAIKLFLQQPLLLHGHVKDFADDTFSGAVKRVNQLYPAIQWTSMGGVCNSLYLKRRISPNHYRVRVYGTRTVIPVAGVKGQAFIFELVEHANAKIDYVRVNGKAVALRAGEDNGLVVFDWTADNKNSALVEINYEDQLSEFTPASEGRDSIRISALRRISDFRDIVLSTSTIGRQVTDRYYSSGGKAYGVISLLVAAIVLVSIFFGMYAKWRARRKRQF